MMADLGGLADLQAHNTSHRELMIFSYTQAQRLVLLVLSTCPSLTFNTVKFLFVDKTVNVFSLSFSHHSLVFGQ